MAEKLTLVSFDLCPYVQRAAIVLAEKGVPFERIDVDLANKPDWFNKISPLGKVPLLKVGDKIIFESAVIVEYLEETHGPALHPSDPLEKARHRAWMEFGSAILGHIWAMETVRDQTAFDAAVAALTQKLTRVEAELDGGPLFGGDKFSIVDAVFAPVFRYFDTFDAIADFGVLNGLTNVAAWRHALRQRSSVRNAVGPDYDERLRRFLVGQDGVLGRMLAERHTEAA
jgi:glutathione S-transferase